MFDQSLLTTDASTTFFPKQASTTAQSKQLTPGSRNQNLGPDGGAAGNHNIDDVESDSATEEVTAQDKKRRKKNKKKNKKKLAPEVNFKAQEPLIEQ